MQWFGELYDLENRKAVKMKVYAYDDWPRCKSHAFEPYCL